MTNPMKLRTQERIMELKAQLAEAHDEIARLREENEKLKAALQSAWSF